MSAPVGSLAAEAAQLLDVAALRLAAIRDSQGGRDHDRVAAPTGDRDVPSEAGVTAAPSGDQCCPHCGHDPAASVTCTRCPLCAALALLRGERPDVATRLVDGALTVVSALRGLLAGAGGPDADAASAQRARSTGHAEAPPADDAPGSHQHRLVRIDVS